MLTGIGFSGIGWGICLFFFQKKNFMIFIIFLLETIVFTIIALLIEEILVEKYSAQLRIDFFSKIFQKDLLSIKKEKNNILKNLNENCKKLSKSSISNAKTKFVVISIYVSCFSVCIFLNWWLAIWTYIPILIFLSSQFFFNGSFSTESKQLQKIFMLFGVVKENLETISIQGTGSTFFNKIMNEAKDQFIKKKLIKKILFSFPNIFIFILPVVVTIVDQDEKRDFLSILILGYYSIGCSICWIKEISNFSFKREFLDNLKEIKKEQKLPGKKIEPLFESISFINITFRFPDDNFDFFKNFNLKIETGIASAIICDEKTKKVITGLLLRYYEPSEGQILIGKKNINKFEISTLREKIGLIPEESQLFNDTIEYNLTYGIKNFERNEILLTARLAGLNWNPFEDVSKIGIRGCEISPGERKKLELTKNLIKLPKLMFIEEQNAKITTEEEKAYYESLKSLLEVEELTSILFSSKKFLLNKCQHVVVIKDGYIKEAGSFHYLLEKRGVLFQIIKEQLIN